MEELDEFGIPIKKTSKSTTAVDEFGIPIKKKDSSIGTATPKNSVSETTIGSSGGKGFPKVKDYRIGGDLGSGVSTKSKIPAPKNTIIEKKAPVKKEEPSFFEYLKDNLDAGLTTISKSFYDAPGMVYDAAASITNIPFRLAGVSEDKLASSDKLASDLGIKNIPSEILKKRIKETNDNINAYAVNNGGDALTALENGNFSGAAKMVAGSTMQSLPIMVAAMASGGSTAAMTVIGVSTASTKNAELKESNPEMGLGARISNAATSGVIEAVTGHLFTGASGAVMKRIITDKGVDVGSKIISNGFKRTIEKTIEKNPLVGAVGEIIEESSVEFANQVNDMASGIRTEFDFRAIKNAGLSATGMGGLQTIGVYGAKGYIGAQNYNKIKNVNKEIGRLNLDIENENTTPENKILIAEKINQLVADNKKLLGSELEKLKTLPAETKKELNGIATLLSDIKSKAEDIKEDNSISPENKQIALNELNDQLKVAGKRKIEILSSLKDVVVDNDFSRFDGVDPDFDLGNGKIATLPLKEQDRLNDQALQELTGGDMTIEVTKEQVSQKSNEIYENEQNSPTSEAQPQAEVQKPSEAEKVEIKNEGKADAPTKENIDERLRINHPFYEKVSEALNKLGVINKYNPETKEGDVVGGYSQETSDGGFSVGGFIFSKDGSISFLKDGVKVEFDKNGNVISENTKEIAQEKNKIEIEGTKESITNLEKTRDREAFKYKDVTETDVLGNRKKVKRLKTAQELKESTDKINAAIDKSKSRLTELEALKSKETPKPQEVSPVEDVVAPGVEKSNYVFTKSPSLENAQAINIEEANVSNEPEITERILNNEEHWDRALLDGVKNEGNGWFEVGKTVQGESVLHAPSTNETVVIKDSENKGGRNGVYKNNFIENNPRNEATPETNTPTDGNLRPTTPNVGESGNAEPKSPAKESVPSSVDGGEAKGDVEVAKKTVTLPNLDDIADFINQTYLNDGKQETKPTAESNKGTKENSLDKNSEEHPREAKAKKISLKGRTPLNKRKFKGDRAKASNVEVTDEHSLVLNHFVNGGKISSDYVEESLSEGDKKAKNNSFNGIASKGGKRIDALAHELWDNNHHLDIAKIKESIEDVVRSHDTVQDITETILKSNDVSPEKSPEEYANDYANHYEVKEEQKASDKVMQEAESSLEQLSEAEIIELAESQDKSYEDYLKDLEKRQVTYDFGPFSEKGTIQPDGWILSETGDLLSPESVSNVKQVNPEVETKKPISKDTPELKEVNAKLVKANENLRIAKDALARKAKSLDKELVKDNEDIFGERKNQNENKLFDERVDGNARNKATEKERKAITDAQNEIKSLTDAKAKIESGEIVSTKEMDFAEVVADAEYFVGKKYKTEFIDAGEKAFTSSRVQVEFKTRQTFDENLEINFFTIIAYNNQGKKIGYAKFILEEDGSLTGNEVEVDQKYQSKGVGTAIYENARYKGFVIKPSVLQTPEGRALWNSLNNNTKQQLKEKANAEVDRIAQKVKDLLPGIKDPDLHTQGVSQDQLIDLIATAVKKLISAGIDVNVAITQVVDSIKAKFGDIDIDIEAIKEKVNPKEETFESKPRKKSLLNRAFEGGNSDVITAAIEENGLDYRIENQEEAKKRAEDFVNQVGPANALEAVRSNQIKGAEKAFVYSTIIDGLLKEIDATTDPIAKEQLEAEHAKIIADITNEFSQESTDAGRFISALNKIYNSSKLRYNLKSQVEAHKASNNGNISDEVLEKFTQTDKRIKELEKLIEEAEAKAKKAEDELAVKNVQEDIERKKQLANKNKSGLTPKEQTRKKELKNKFFGRLNDATSMVTMLADPEFREYLGLTFKQAKGDLANFTKRIVNELGKGAQKHIPQLFDEAQKSAPTKNNTIKIGKNGKLSIPAQLFRDYVEAGENDIDVIAAKIKEDIADEFPDADVRDIRDALTGYGKQINPTKDDVSLEITRLKSLGKLISAYEDASNGISPLKSGLKREKPTQEMRTLRKEINRLIKENGLDAVDLEKQWASALDKIKSQLANQIEDLDKQIANGEKRKVERTTTPLDAEATALKSVRDAKKQILDDLVGKPELTEEQLIARAEKSLEASIEKLQKEITEGKIAYNEKPSQKQSQKLEDLRQQRKELVETKNQMRKDAGLVEEQRLKNTKKRVRNQIEDLNRRIADKDYSKKEVTPLIDDSELSQLRAEKLRQQEVYDAQKYADELRNRSSFQKWTDAILELWNVPRILKATGELSTVLIQGGILTTSRKLTNPKALGKIMKELFKSLGSAKKATYYESLIKAHPLYPLAEKSKLALTNPDYKSDVREEQYSGDYANLAWDLPFVFASYNKRAAKFINKERAVLGDALKKITRIGTPGTDKLSIRDQWKNANPFVVLERGGTLYMNTLRMEEFVRGCEMLRMEGKNEVDHLQDYKLLANAINSMTGRANLPTAVAPSSKLLAAVFFSARNAVSIVNQVNPVYYGYLHFGSTDKFQLNKTSVANKLAVSNMVRFVAITGAMVLAIKAAAGKDEEDEDIVQIELDPNSSDFMKMKIGDIRFDPWHGMTTMIVLMSRLISENVKSTSTGETTKLGEKRFGPQSRLDLIGSWARNKFSPSAAISANYLNTHEETDDMTGESFRETPFGKKFTEDESLDLTPMYWSAVKEIQAEDPGAMAEFLTVISVFGWNTSVYKPAESKKSTKSVPGVPNFGAMKMNP